MLLFGIEGKKEGEKQQHFELLNWNFLLTSEGTPGNDQVQKTPDECDSLVLTLLA